MSKSHPTSSLVVLGLGLSLLVAEPAARRRLSSFRRVFPGVHAVCIGGYRRRHRRARCMVRAAAAAILRFSSCSVRRSAPSSPSWSGSCSSVERMASARSPMSPGPRPCCWKRRTRPPTPTARPWPRPPRWHSRRRARRRTSIVQCSAQLDRSATFQRTESHRQKSIGAYPRQMYFCRLDSA